MPSLQAVLRGALMPALRSVLLVAIIGCDRQTSAVATSSRAEDPPGTDDSVGVVTETAPSGWEAEAGPLLLLPDEAGSMTGAILQVGATDRTLADTAGLAALLHAAPLEFFSRSGQVERTRVRLEGPPPTDPGCTAWPTARLAPVTAAETVAPPSRWTAAFLAGRVEPIPLDSIEAMPPRDSAQLAAHLSRLASALPDDTSATFRARPYVVLRAWRSRDVDQALLVGVLVRRVNQEDAPREERLILVVDGPAAPAPTGTPKGSPAGSPWRVGWHERAEGTEEELIVAEPLLAYRVRGLPDVHLLFGRDDGFSLSASVLVHRRDGWHILWESAIAGCG